MSSDEVVLINPMSLIVALCKAGFTVELSGEDNGWVTIQTENGDIAFSAGSSTHERALLHAAAPVYEWLNKGVTTLRPFMPEPYFVGPTVTPDE